MSAQSRAFLLLSCLTAALILALPHVLPLKASVDSAVPLVAPTPAARVLLPLVMKLYPPTSPPAAPSSLGGMTPAQGLIVLGWSDNSDNEEGFGIEQYAAGSFTLVKTVGPGVTTTGISSLLPSTQYKFRVYAYNSLGNSAYSNEFSITTLMAPPALPGGLSATSLSNTRIQLDWTDNSDNELQFRIEQEKGGLLPDLSFIVVPANTSSTILTDLSANTVYTYRIRAENSGGTSNYSDYASARTMWNQTWPYAPSSLVATPLSSSSIRLSWIDNATNENGYRYDRSVAGGSFGMTQTLGTNVTNTIISDLSPGTQYTFRVWAYRTGYSNSGFNLASATTLANVAPFAPGNLTAAPVSTTTVILNWQDNSNNETGFKVEERAGVGSFFVVATTAAGVNNFTRTGRSPGTQYTYRTYAYNSYGNSTHSNWVTITTPSNTRPPISLPAPPTDHVAIPTSSSTIDLYWNNVSDNDDGIKLQHSTDGVRFEDYFTGTDPGTNHAKDAGLDPASTHYYRVSTYNLAGQSAWSDVAWATTFGTTSPDAPTNLQAVATSPSVVRLTFDHTVTNTEGFMLSASEDNVTWYTDFASVTVKTVDVYNLQPGRQYWFKVRAYNRKNATQLNVSPFNTNGVRSASTPGSGNTTRFYNNSSYPIISLVVGSQGEQFAAPPLGIPPGGYYEMTLTQGGSYQVSWTNGFWDEYGQRSTLYQGGSTHNQPTGQGTYHIQNPTLSQLLTHFGPQWGRGYWVGEVWVDTYIHSQGFCFQNNGTDAPPWSFYIDGQYNSGGSAYIPSGGYPQPGTLNVNFNVAPGANYQGTLNEAVGNAYFYMRNGPPGWEWVKYYYSGNTCP